ALFLGGPALVDEAHDVFPVLQVALYVPVDQLAERALDAWLGVLQDLVLELLLHRLGVEQFRDAPEPHGVVEEGVAAVLDVAEYVLQADQVRVELAPQVLGELRGLTL